VLPEALDVAFFYSSVALLFEKVTFSSPHALSSAIDYTIVNVASGSLELLSSRFTDLTISVSLLTFSATSVFALEDSNFTSIVRTSGHGGCLNVAPSQTEERHNVTNCVFDKCQVSENGSCGGAIYVKFDGLFDPLVKLTIEDCTFQSCSAAPVTNGRGGAVYIELQNAFPPFKIPTVTLGSALNQAANTASDGQDLFLKSPSLAITMEFPLIGFFESDVESAIALERRVARVLSIISKRDVLLAEFHNVDRSFQLRQFTDIYRPYLLRMDCGVDEVTDTQTFVFLFLQLRWDLAMREKVEAEIRQKFATVQILFCAKCDCMFCPSDGSECVVRFHAGKRTAFRDGTWEVTEGEVAYWNFACCGKVPAAAPACSVNVYKEHFPESGRVFSRLVISQKQVAEL
jgi:hypothetical protein